MKHIIKSKKGQSIVELLVTMALMAILLPAILGGFIAAREGKAQETKIRASKESLSSAVEAVLLIRDKGFENIATDGVYYISNVENSYSLVKNPIIDENGISTSVEIQPILRNSEQTIVSQGGSIDPVAKKVTLKSSWDGLFQNSIQTTLVLTRNTPNASFIQTTAEDFSSGTLLGVIVENTEDGEVILARNTTEGVYESSMVDLGYSSAINTIKPKLVTPLGTQVEYQISLSDVTTDNCNDAESFYTGPDGTDQTFYTGSQMVKFDDDGASYENPGRCFKYKVFFKSEVAGVSPVFESLSVNFSQ